MTKNDLVIKVINTSEIGKFDKLSNSSFYIGRSKDCLVFIDDKQISREQIALDYRQGEWYLRNLNEKIILLNGVPLIDKKISNSDFLIIGDVKVVFNFDDSDLTKTITQSTYQQNQQTEPSTESYQYTETIALKNIKENPVIQNAPVSFLAESPIEETPLEMNERIDDVANLDINQDENKFGLDLSLDKDMKDNIEEVDNDHGPIENDFNMEMSENQSVDEQSFDDSGDSTRVMQSFATIYVEIISEHSKFDEFNIDQETIYIGRDPQKCQLAFDDTYVSRTHSVIKKKGATVTIEDLKSSTGTIVNGKRINRIELKDGDMIEIGDSKLIFHNRSSLLDKESGRLLPVGQTETIETEEIVDIETDMSGGENQFTESGNLDLSGVGQPEEKSIFKNPEKRKKLLYVVVVGVLAYTMFDEDKKAPEKPKEEKPDYRLDKSKPVTGSGSGSEAPQATGSGGVVGIHGAISNEEALKRLTPEQRNEIKINYEVAKSLSEQEKYNDALVELDKILAIAPQYEQARFLYDVAKQALAKIEAAEKERKKEEDRKILLAQVKDLVEKARVAVKDHQQELADGLFNQIVKLDPNNMDVPNMKLELEAYVNQKKFAENEKRKKIDDRQKMVDSLQPGKTHYLKKEWNQAIGKLEIFLKESKMDDDLIKEATTMLGDAKEQIKTLVDPLIGKARSLKEGQDLKGAFETYDEVLKYEPDNAEAKLTKAQILDSLTEKARKVYRDALVAESLSLFQEAKEKFQEVQQISPVGSEYYVKASEKLKNYLD